MITRVGIGAPKYQSWGMNSPKEFRLSLLSFFRCTSTKTGVVEKTTSNQRNMCLIISESEFFSKELIQLEEHFLSTDMIMPVLCI